MQIFWRLHLKFHKFSRSDIHRLPWRYSGKWRHSPARINPTTPLPRCVITRIMSRRLIAYRVQIRRLIIGRGSSTDQESVLCAAARYTAVRVPADRGGACGRRWTQLPVRGRSAVDLGGRPTQCLPTILKTRVFFRLASRCITCNNLLYQSSILVTRSLITFATEVML